MKKNIIDINADVGEIPNNLADGREEKIISMISSANIACGGHAGDENSILEVMKLCDKYGVKIGAHPSYPDRKNFGRLEINSTYEEITEFVYQQVKFFVEIAAKNNFEVIHIKPHGALYNSAAKSENISFAIANGIRKVSKEFVLFGLATSAMIEVWRNEGFTVFEEAFADRRYESDGSLRSREFNDAVYASSYEAALQAISIAETGKIISVDGKEVLVNADTICVHGDSENSLDVLSKINLKFMERGIKLTRKV